MQKTAFVFKRYLLTLPSIVNLVLLKTIAVIPSLALPTWGDEELSNGLLIVNGSPLSCLPRKNR